MTYQEIKSFINTYIVQNGVNAITGSQLNTALNALADYYGFDSVVVTTLPAGSEATVNVQGRTLELGIPKGADGQKGRDGQNGRDGLDATNPFKGWFNSLADLKASYTASIGDSAYVKDASPATTWSIYIYDSTASSDNYWADSGLNADTSNVQTFASGEEVNETYIDNTRLENPAAESLAKATDAKSIREGNLAKVQSSETPIIITDTSVVNNVKADSSRNIFQQAQGFSMHYFKAEEDCVLDYKLGSGNVAGQYAIVLSDSIPAVDIPFSNGVERISNSEGSLVVAKNKYICISVVYNVPSYYPQSLSIITQSGQSVQLWELLGEKSQSSRLVSTNIWDAIEEVDSKITPAEPSYKENKIPYLIECASFFWMRKEATNFDESTPFNVSGSANSTTLNVGVGGQDTSVLTSVDEQAAIVISDDDGKCTPHILISWTADTLTIFPAIKKTITNGVLVPLLADSQHLTKLGYHAWSEHLYAANPRYCEKNLYITRFANVDSWSASPFTKIGGNSLVEYTASANDNNDWKLQYGNHCGIWRTYADQSTIGEYGVEWSVDTGSNKGYLESMVGTSYESDYTPTLEKDNGYEMHIEVYADDVMIYEYIKGTNYVERICVPYEKENKIIKLKIYYTHLRAHKESISVGMTTFWVNEQDVFPIKMFPDYSVISWFMASWGEKENDGVYVTDRDADNFPDAAEYPSTEQINYKDYYQGASGLAMRELISKSSGVTLPIYIRSKSGTTTRFGKAWWAVLVKPYNPNIMVTSFGVNDYHTNTNPGEFGDLLDPFGNIIDMSTPILPAEYANNIKAMIDMCAMNNITFIHAEGSIAQSFDWLISLENNLSSQIEE